MLRQRIYRWLDSDLVGIPATLYTFAVLAASLIVFGFAGPVAGIIVAVTLWVPMVLFAIRGAGRQPLPLGLEAARQGRHRVLVVANQGLEDPALCAEVCRRAERSETEVMILAPVFTPSKLGVLADDVGTDDLRTAEARVGAAVRTLEGHGVKASGRVDLTAPPQAALDGLREFPANELVVLPGRETGWTGAGAGAMTERIRDEVGVPVTVIGPDDHPPDRDAG